MGHRALANDVVGALPLPRRRAAPLPGEIGSRDKACLPGDDGMEIVQQSRKSDLGAPATAQHPRWSPAGCTHGEACLEADHRPVESTLQRGIAYVCSGRYRAWLGPTLRGAQGAIARVAVGRGSDHRGEVAGEVRLVPVAK